MSSLLKPYPYAAYKFRVEIEGITAAMVSEVNGLQSETEVEPYEEGGVNHFVYQLPKRTKPQPITLKRGITDAADLWDWHMQVVRGRFRRKLVAIVLMDLEERDVWRWNVCEAYPVKWTGSDLKADGSAVFFESVVLAHHGVWKG